MAGTFSQRLGIETSDGKRVGSTGDYIRKIALSRLWPGAQGISRLSNWLEKRTSAAASTIQIGPAI